MTTSQQGRSNPMVERMSRFKTECPAAGDEFPPVEGITLDGESWNLEALRGRVVILETGAFT